MKKIEEIDCPLDPIRKVIRDFLHVEWFEVDELRQKIETRSVGADVGVLRSQFDDLLSADSLPIEQLNALSGNEFETSQEAKAWLSAVYQKIFPVTAETLGTQNLK